MLQFSSKFNLLSNELCSSIIAIDNHITFVAIINENGMVDESQSRNCIIDKLPKTRKEMFFMENALRHRMREEYDGDLGQERFTYVERDKRGLLSFPLNNQLLLISFLRNHVKPIVLANRITHLVHRYQQKLKDKSLIRISS